MKQAIIFTATLLTIIFLLAWGLPYIKRQLSMLYCLYLIKRVQWSVKDKETKEKLKEVENGIKAIIKEEEF